jgi:hypothetical protein
MAKSGVYKDGRELLACELERMSPEECGGIIAETARQSFNKARERVEEVRRDLGYVRGSLDTIRALVRH